MGLGAWCIRPGNGRRRRRTDEKGGRKGEERPNSHGGVDKQPRRSWGILRGGSDPAMGIPTNLASSLLSEGRPKSFHLTRSNCHFGDQVSMLEQGDNSNYESGKFAGVADGNPFGAARKIVKFIVIYSPIILAEPNGFPPAMVSNLVSWFIVVNL